MPARLLIFKLFSRQHALILHSVFIDSNIFDQTYQKFMFFRLQYAHFWALILVSIKFSRRHVYYFQKKFQQACLFRLARLFPTLEYTGCSRIIGTVRGKVGVASFPLMPHLQNLTWTFSLIKTTFLNTLYQANSINI